MKETPILTAFSALFFFFFPPRKQSKPIPLLVVNVTEKEIRSPPGLRQGAANVKVETTGKWILESRLGQPYAEDLKIKRGNYRTAPPFSAYLHLRTHSRISCNRMYHVWTFKYYQNYKQSLHHLKLFIHNIQIVAKPKDRIDGGKWSA